MKLPELAWRASDRDRSRPISVAYEVDGVRIGDVARSSLLVRIFSKAEKGRVGALAYVRPKVRRFISNETSVALGEVARVVVHFLDEEGRPVDGPTSGACFAGDWLASSDSRWPFDCPVPIHEVCDW